jgi:geranylgeranyl pyrophosphate synthase
MRRSGSRLSSTLVKQMLSQYQEPVSAAMAEFVPEMLKTRTVHDPAAVEASMVRPLRYITETKGKRWRSALFLTFVEGLREKENSSLSADDFKVAAMLELIHNGTLVIDDVEDEALLRRGQATVHEQFGTDVAINVGCLAYFAALKGGLTSAYPPEVQLRLYEAFAENMIDLHVGQGVDIIWHKGIEYLPTEEQYVAMVKGKTGGLSKMASDMACVVTHSSKSVQKKLGRFSQSIGVAFQIIDDCLDLSSPDFHQGKGFAQDIVEGKLSLPMIHALSNSPDALRLRNILGKTSDEELIRDAVSIVSQSSIE